MADGAAPASRSGARIHAFADDALGDLDGVALARSVANGAVDPAELVAAAQARADRVAIRLGAVAHQAARPRRIPNRGSELDAVPTYVKDNVAVAGMPTNYGTAAFLAGPASADGPYTRQLLATGMVVLGKSRMPEFGLNATTEFAAAEPARNPWDPDHSVGGSSGGAAALVAAGVVPLAHANDGGGSIRIPAAAAGLVGLKPTRGRHVDDVRARLMPINLVSEGVVSRSVRDTAAFVHAMERRWRNPALPPVGRVLGVSSRRVRIGLLDATIAPTGLDATTRRALEPSPQVDLDRSGQAGAELAAAGGEAAHLPLAGAVLGQAVHVQGRRLARLDDLHAERRELLGRPDARPRRIDPRVGAGQEVLGEPDLVALVDDDLATERDVVDRVVAVDEHELHGGRGRQRDVGRLEPVVLHHDLEPSVPVRARRPVEEPRQEHRHRDERHDSDRQERGVAPRRGPRRGGGGRHGAPACVRREHLRSSTSDATRSLPPPLGTEGPF
jgi:Asp-tRNA(Asn)/Glu-tRNA(Gln) amidotransferase A subunit family amidase